MKAQPTTSPPLPHSFHYTGLEEAPDSCRGLGAGCPASDQENLVTMSTLADAVPEEASGEGRS